MKQYSIILLPLCILLFSCNSNKIKPEEDFKKYYFNGSLFAEGKYSFDDENVKSRTGIWKFYYFNSVIEEEQEYEGRKLISLKKYYENGELKEIYNSNNLINSDKMFYKNGKLQSESITKYDDEDHDIEQTILTEFHENGKLKHEDFIWKDRKWGDIYNYETTKDYYENGQLKEIKQYQDEIPIGSSKQWDTTGNLVIEVWYESGNIVK